MKASVSSALLALTLGPALIGCMSRPLLPRTNVDSGRVRMLERELRKKQAALEELQERNLVLERKVSERGAHKATIPVPFDPSASHEPPVEETGVSIAVQRPELEKSQDIKPAPRAKLPTRLPAYVSRPGHAQPDASQISAPVADSEAGQALTEAASQPGEQRLYSKVVETYRTHKLGEMDKSLQLLLKTYPDSVYADNALYLAGLLSFEESQNARALGYLNRVLREYPKGDKAVSALFAKAMIQKRVGQLPEARGLLQSIRRMYPGSPEAARAAVESKFIEQMQHKLKNQRGEA